MPSVLAASATTTCAVSTARRASRSRVVSVHASDAGTASRRSAALALAAAPLLLLANPASARNYLDAKKAAEERKEKLKAAAEGMREKGVTQSAFKDSGYSVSEEARTPNVHSRQEEGAKSQENI